jgi:site-specific DNA-methyltransferase (adenine-specific)
MEKFLNSLIVGDCLEVLKEFPDESIDVVITSPPYNKHYAGGRLVKRIDYEVYQDDMPEEEYASWQLQVLKELYRVVKNDGHVFYNNKVRYYKKRMYHPITFLINSPFIIWQEIVWDRMIAGNIRGWRLYETDERIYWLVKQPPPELPPYIASWKGVWAIRPDENKTEHPAPFTLEIVKRLLTISEALIHRRPLTILDPFAGICTVGVVAKENNHKYICIDINPKYIEIGKKNIERTITQLSLF